MHSLCISSRFVVESISLWQRQQRVTRFSFRPMPPRERGTMCAACKPCALPQKIHLPPSRSKTALRAADGMPVAFVQLLIKQCPFFGCQLTFKPQIVTFFNEAVYQPAHLRCVICRAAGKKQKRIRAVVIVLRFTQPTYSV